LKRIFDELAKGLRVNPIDQLLHGSGASYEDVLRGRGVVPPNRGKVSKRSQTREGETTYRGCAKIHELRALDHHGRVGKLTGRFYFKIESATLTTRGTTAELILDNVTMYEDRSCSTRLSSYRLRGDGPFEDRIANILYTADDQERNVSWIGVCVLSVPKHGQIHGYWMTAGHEAQGIVLGTLELDPTPTEPVASTG